MSLESRDRLQRNGVILICLAADNTKLGMTRLVVRSVREKGDFTGDILLFTDASGFSGSEYGVIPVHVTDFATLSKHNEMNIKPYIFNPKLFKPFIADYYDLSDYDRLIFLDFDVIVSRRLKPVFDYIQDDETLYFGYAARKRWNDPHANYLSRNFDLTACQNSCIYTSSETGVCSGIFGLKTSVMEKVFRPWRQHIRTLLCKGFRIDDQIPLNELLLMGRIKGKAFPNEWIEYPFTAMLGYLDLRMLKTRDEFIFHHFNPGKAKIKLQYMKIFTAFGRINGRS